MPGKLLDDTRVYPGPNQDKLPDVSVVWNTESRIEAVRSESLGTVYRRWNDRRSGNHTTEAFLVCSGPAFIRGPNILEADARQVAPTVLYLLGLDAPAHYETGAMYQVLREPHVGKA